MRTFDYSPLFRSTVGFDRLTQLLDAASGEDSTPSYPPYNIERMGEDAYRITMAVAGFTADDIDIALREGLLTISSKGMAEEDNGKYLYRGIARRAFERRFQLADFIKVEGARLENGLLHVELLREVPEALKPRTIKISTDQTAKSRSIPSKVA